MKLLILCLLGLQNTFAQSQKMPYDKQAVTVLKSLQYFTTPLRHGKDKQKEITKTKEYQAWLINLKKITDHYFDAEFEDETQFGNAIELVNDRIENDQLPFSGYFGDAKKNEKYLKKEAAIFKATEKERSSVFAKYTADAFKPQVRSLGPVWAKDLHTDAVQKNNANSNKCQDSCPLNYEVLKQSLPALAFGIDEEAQANFTNFRNLPEDFNPYIKKQFGFCWGHTSTMYKFSLYATFKKDLPKEDMSVVQEKMKRVVRDSEFTEFHGYESLFDLSSGEEEKLHLMREINREWARNAMTVGNIVSLQFATGARKKKYYMDVYNEVVKRILSNQLVQIKFNSEVQNGWSHIVSAYGFEETEMEYRIYIKDPNFYPMTLEKTERLPFGYNFLAIKKRTDDKGGIAFYPLLVHAKSLHRNVRLGLMEVTDEGKILTMEAIEKYQNKCVQKTHCK